MRLPSRTLAISAALALALAAPLTALLGPAAPAARAADAASTTALFAKDDAFRWEVVSTTAVPGGTMRTVRLTSQKWQGITWTHWLRVIEPTVAKNGDSALLLVSGGRNRDEAPGALKGELMMLPLIAAETGTVVCMLEQTPNQPLFDGLNEDRLIAHTFKKFLESGDASWPALVPMVRSAMRAMDAVQEMTAGQEGKKKVERFFVTGASKRGWTSWLTAAHDARVVGISPMVIDVVNMRKQMPHQVESFGTYSNQIDPYTQLGLPQKVDGPEAASVLDIVDPWTFKDRLTLPKLIVLGTNDPYWTADAVNLYFGGLKGEKYVSYVPNAGHGLGPAAYQTASVYYQQVVEGTPRPRFTWTRATDLAGRATTIEVTAEDLPSSVDLFTTSAETRDLRKAKWTSEPVSPRREGGPGRWSAVTALPEAGVRASYLQLTYKDAKGRPMTLCTTIEVVDQHGVSGPTVATGTEWTGFPAAKPAASATAPAIEASPATPKRAEF